MGERLAQGGSSRANAVEVTHTPRPLSYQTLASGVRPPPKIAPRSFKETLTTRASGRSFRRRSATVSARRTADDEPGVPAMGPFGPTIDTAGSRRMLTLAPAAFTMSFAKIPDPRGGAPV